VVCSDECGAWSLAADGTAQCHRQVARRYWHHPGRLAAPS
jgi:competence protein ComEC